MTRVEFTVALSVILIVACGGLVDRRPRYGEGWVYGERLRYA